MFCPAVPRQSARTQPVLDSGRAQSARPQSQSPLREAPDSHLLLHEAPESRLPLHGARVRAGRRQVPYIQVEPHTKSHAFHLALTAVIGLASFQAGPRPRDPVGPVGPSGMPEDAASPRGRLPKAAPQVA